MSIDLAADLQAYAAGRRDSKREQALLRRIRALPQPQRMEIIAPLLKARFTGALSMADRAQLTRDDYVVISSRASQKRMRVR